MSFINVFIISLNSDFAVAQHIKLVVSEDCVVLFLLDDSDIPK